MSITEMFCADTGALTVTGSVSVFAGCTASGFVLSLADGCAASSAGAASEEDGAVSLAVVSSVEFCVSCPASRFSTCAVLLLLLAISVLPP